MAIQLGGGGTGRGRSRYSHSMAEINIIPLVDVTLVLLIIFMVTAQVMEFGLEIEVPKVDSSKQSAEELPIISITKKGEFQVAEKSVKLHEMADEIKRRYPNHKAVYVRADKDAVWQPIAQVISRLGKAQLEVRMVTQGN